VVDVLVPFEEELSGGDGDRGEHCVVHGGVVAVCRVVDAMQTAMLVDLPATMGPAATRLEAIAAITRAGHVTHIDAVVREVTGQAGTPRPGAFDTDRDDLSESHQVV